MSEENENTEENHEGLPVGADDIDELIDDIETMDEGSHDETNDDDPDDSDVPNPESADDLISEEEQGIIGKLASGAKKMFGKKEDEGITGEAHRAGSPVKEIPASKFTPQKDIITDERNEIANRAEAERVLKEHEQKKAHEKKGKQFKSPIDESFDNATINFKGTPVRLKIKKGYYNLRKDDYEEIGSEAEFRRCLIANKFDEV